MQNELRVTFGVYTTLGVPLPSSCIHAFARVSLYLLFPLLAGSFMYLVIYLSFF